MTFHIGRILENPDVSQMSAEYIYGSRSEQRFIPCTVASGNGEPGGNFGRIRGGTVLTRYDEDCGHEELVNSCRPYGETTADGEGTSSNTLIVNDASCYFVGDYILVDGSETEIIAIDGLELTLGSDESWADGDEVVLAKPDGQGGYVACQPCGILYMDVDTWLRRSYSGENMHTSVPAQLHVVGTVRRERIIGLGPVAEIALRLGSGTNILFFDLADIS